MITPTKDAIADNILARINENPFEIILSLVNQITQLTQRLDQVEANYQTNPIGVT